MSKIKLREDLCKLAWDMLTKEILVMNATQDVTDL
jgi:hypothetical protein